MLHSIRQQIWKTQQWPQGWKRSIFISIPKKDNVKKCPYYLTIAPISRASKVTLKVLQHRLQQYVKWKLPDVNLDLEKWMNQRSNCQHLLDHRKTREFPKNISFCFTEYAKAFVWITTNYGKLIKRMEYQTLPASWETCMQVKNEAWNNELVPNWERSMSRLCIITVLI